MKLFARQASGAGRVFYSGRAAADKVIAVANL
jgi:hypothetical protein